MIIGVITICLLLIPRENYSTDKNYTAELIKHFLLDNPNGDGVEGTSGSDPTGGVVDYSFMFEKDKEDNIIPNENGDTT